MLQTTKGKVSQGAKCYIGLATRIGLPSGGDMIIMADSFEELNTQFRLITTSCSDLDPDRCQEAALFDRLEVEVSD